MESKGEILIYQNSLGNIKIDVRLEEETVWLTQDQMAALFGKAKSTINEHIKNVFAEGELDEKVVVRKFRITTQHGAIVGKTQEVEVNGYNLDVIISVGYRMKSQQGTQFRIWATQRLKEYIIKGFTLNDDRFKSGNSMNYFNELQERIREIRISERFFYQKIKDIYTTSIDYVAKEIVSTLATQLVKLYGRSFTEPNIRRMIQFAEEFSDITIVTSLLTKLSWTHFIQLFTLKSYEEKMYYAEQFTDFEIVVPLARQLSWSHILLLLPLKCKEENH